MNFAGALFALQRGHKVKRHHWTGYWEARQRLSDNKWIIEMHTYNGKTLDITKTKDIMYTLSNCACEELGPIDCKHCWYGNPCFGCADYLETTDTCRSHGGCGVKRESTLESTGGENNGND